jgi:hypothetical protein
MLANIEDLRRFLELGPDADEQTVRASLAGPNEDEVVAAFKDSWFPELGDGEAELVTASLGRPTGEDDLAALGAGPRGGLNHV